MTGDRERAARLLNIAPAFLNVRLLPDDDATYWWTTGRGDAAVIIGGDGGVLYATSTVAPESHIAALRAGKRTTAFEDR